MSPTTRRMLRPLWFFLALLFLVEAWIWERLKPAVAWLVGLIPFERFKAALATGIARLPPYATLLVFAIPGLMLLPFKLAGLWLIGGGHVIAGGLVFLMAKTVGLAVTAFLFETCRPKLMELGWFVRFYALMLRLKDWAHRQTEPARRALHLFKIRLGNQKSRVLAFIARLRRRSFSKIG
ncbi:MAG: hypothetical protein CFE31_17315 [Rhizobiales bacterium PAR1]|nr:MAG: hypothetical protein CFE31_17315 [Rhizobiales bacterium PAR1]